MKGAIFFASKYGSTEQYAKWIGEAADLPVFNVKDKKPDPANYDFLVLGAPIIYYMLLNRKWLIKNASKIAKKPTILFTVSGAPAGKKLDGWLANSNVPASLISKMEHVALGGRQNPKELTWFDRIMLIIAAMKNPDPKASKEESQGFDYMDQASIEPIVKIVQDWQSK